MKLLDLELRESMRNKVVDVEKAMNEVAESMASHPGNWFLRVALARAVETHVRLSREFIDKWGQLPTEKVEVVYENHASIPFRMYTPLILEVRQKIDDNIVQKVKNSLSQRGFSVWQNGQENSLLIFPRDKKQWENEPGYILTITHSWIKISPQLHGKTNKENVKKIIMAILKFCPNCGKKTEIEGEENEADAE